MQTQHEAYKQHVRISTIFYISREAKNIVTLAPDDHFVAVRQTMAWTSPAVVIVMVAWNLNSASVVRGMRGPSDDRCETVTPRTRDPASA